MASLRAVKQGDGPAPDEFRVPASDTKGHSARQWFRCIPAMARQVEQVIQAKQFPYRTKGDVLRHALHRHMKWLSGLDSVISVSGQVDAILEIMRDEAANKDFELVFGKLESQISKHLTEGSKGEAMRLLLVVQRHVGLMPEGFWKDRYQAQIRERYGDLLKDGKKAMLGEMEEVE